MNTQHNYQDRIIVDPKIMVGKPVVKGTRIPVEIVLERLAEDLDLKAFSDETRTISRSYHHLQARFTLFSHCHLVYSSLFLTLEKCTTCPKTLTEIPTPPQKNVNRNR